MRLNSCKNLRQQLIFVLKTETTLEIYAIFSIKIKVCSIKLTSKRFCFLISKQSLKPMILKTWTTLLPSYLTKKPDFSKRMGKLYKKFTESEEEYSLNLGKLFVFRLAISTKHIQEKKFD